MNVTPVASVCFPIDNHIEWHDDKSEVTCDFSCRADADHSQEEGQAPEHPRLRKSFGRNSSSIGRSQDNEQELIEAKLEIAKQREELDILRSKLSRCQKEKEDLAVENKSLKMEKTALVEEVAQFMKEKKLQSNAQKRWFGAAERTSSGGSMQLLLETNSKLMMDNNRLQASIASTRKSFQNYMKEARQANNTDKQTIKTLQHELQHERDVLHRRLDVQNTFQKIISESERTSRTSMISSFNTTRFQDEFHLASSVKFDDDSSQQATQGSQDSNSRFDPRHDAKQQVDDISTISFTSPIENLMRVQEVNFQQQSSIQRSEASQSQYSNRVTTTVVATKRPSQVGTIIDDSIRRCTQDATESSEFRKVYSNTKIMPRSASMPMMSNDKITRNSHHEVTASSDLCKTEICKKIDSDLLVDFGDTRRRRRTTSGARRWYSSNAYQLCK